MADELTPGYPEIERLAPSEVPAAIVTGIRAAEEDGAAREREACALIASGHAERFRTDMTISEDYAVGSIDAAEAIRDAIKARRAR